MKQIERARARAIRPVKRAPRAVEQALAQRPKRRRRSPDVAESEILEAAERLLRHVPFRKLTIGGLMATTGLRRPSFYQYFNDLYEVLAKLAQRHAKDLFEKTQRYADSILNMSDRDMLSEESAANRHAEFVRVCRIFRENRHFHRLLFQGSALDPAVRRIYRNYIRSIAEHTADLIRQLQRKGVATWLDADETALALCLMTEFYVYEKVVDGTGSDLDKAAETMRTIWEQVIYGQLPRFKSLSFPPDKLRA
jgi:TetR/AcrR family transcriptional regulator, ethionamide resistance regulator